MTDFCLTYGGRGINLDEARKDKRSDAFTYCSIMKSNIVRSLTDWLRMYKVKNGANAAVQPANE